MIWASIGATLLGLPTFGYLIRIGRRPWTWQRPVKAPKTSDVHYTDDPSVGYV